MSSMSSNSWPANNSLEPLGYTKDKRTPPRWVLMLGVDQWRRSLA
jgi:hypothetical protein